jgi:glycosyltransferase involved in cell wall biosynthesis
MNRAETGNVLALTGQRDPGGRRVAIVSHSHPSLTKGGAEIAAYTLFTGLLGLGVDAIFIAACPEADRARISLASHREHVVVFEPALYDHFYQLAPPGAAVGLLNLLVEQRVEIVNFHHFLNHGIEAVGALADRPGIGTFFTLHEFLPICRHHGQMITRPALTLCETSSPVACATCYPENTAQQFAQRRQLFLEAFAAVDGFISPSRFLANRFADWGLPPERIAVVENGLPQRPPQRAPRPRHDGDAWVFAFFGQINPFKGLSTLLQAAEAIGRDRSLARRVRLRIHGNLIGQPQSFIDRFEALVQKLDFLSYAGPYDNAQVGRLMAAADYVVVPSIWWENSPLVIQEAYAIGRPVICTGIGGMAEKVRDGVSGLHFRLGDEGDLVRVFTAAARPETFERLSAGLPPVADAADMARAYLEAFARLRPPPV